MEIGSVKKTEGTEKKTGGEEIVSIGLGTRTWKENFWDKLTNREGKRSTGQKGKRPTQPMWEEATNRSKHRSCDPRHKVAVARCLKAGKMLLKGGDLVYIKVHASSKDTNYKRKRQADTNLGVEKEMPGIGQKGGRKSTVVGI